MKKKLDIARLTKPEAKTKKLDLAFIVEVAIGLWRIQQAMQRENQAGDDLASKRSWKNLQRLLSQLSSRGVTIQDPTGSFYDPGMSVRVVASEERKDLTREVVQESITPSVFLNATLIHAGEIVVATPSSATSP